LSISSGTWSHGTKWALAAGNGLRELGELVPGLLLDLLKDLAALVGSISSLEPNEAIALLSTSCGDRWNSCGSLPMRQDQ
jgi:hypothetical protein